MIVFVRTKQATGELPARARGFPQLPSAVTSAGAAGSGPSRRLRDGDIDILVAADVAARGLDERISRVTTTSARHRVLRTGSGAPAWRAFDALIFVSPREAAHEKRTQTRCA